MANKAEIQGYTSTNFRRLAINCKAYGTDGSGGPVAIPADLSAVGSGVAVVDFDENTGIPAECATMFASPPGRQTVNRAELYALILGGEYPDHRVSAYTDSSYAIKQISANITNSSTADLIEDAISSIPNVDLIKVKAHA